MFKSHTFFTRTDVKDLEKIVKSFQEKFDENLNDEFSEHELEVHERLLDSMAAVYVQPILSELSFGDFYVDPPCEEQQRKFFESCRSSVLLENLPYLEANPFQVSYNIELMSILGEVLVDRGGIENLMFKNDYLKLLQKYKKMDSLIQIAVPVTIKKTSSHAPVSPMDFLVRDVYTELGEMVAKNKTASVQSELTSVSESMRKVFEVFQEPGLDAESLMLLSKLNPKVFGDQLESLKFFLRRINRS